MKNFGIAVIGCGQAWYNHLVNFMSEPEISHVVAVDVSKNRLDEIRSKHSVRTTTDFKDVLKDPDIKAVVIASSNDTPGDLLIYKCCGAKPFLIECPRNV